MTIKEAREIATACFLDRRVLYDMFGRLVNPSALVDVFAEALLTRVNGKPPGRAEWSQHYADEAAWVEAMAERVGAAIAAAEA